jgi:chemotaxis regulatin CheY-phosphate phosphatase CheZ
MNKYLIAGMNLVGNKSTQLAEVMTSNFEDLNKTTAKFMNQFVKNIAQTLVKSMIVAGDTSARLDEVVTANFEDINKSTAKFMNQFVKNIMQTMYNSMTKTGDWSARLDIVMTENFQDINKGVSKEESKFASTMGKMVTDMNKASSAARSLVSDIAKIKSKEVTITTHFKQTGDNGKGGATGNAAEGGIYFSNQARSMTFGEAGDELAIFLPLRRMGEARRGNFDITVPAPTPDLTGLKNTIGGALRHVTPQQVLGSKGSSIHGIVINLVEKVMLNEHEIMTVVKKRMFKELINQI